jgi:hypothetical protein
VLARPVGLRSGIQYVQGDGTSGQSFTPSEASSSNWYAKPLALWAGGLLFNRPGCPDATH